MRISTTQIFEAGTNQISTLRSQIDKTQMQLATNKRILTPSDDPVAAARALEVTQSQSMNTQFSANRTNARNTLSMEEVALGSATSLIQDVQELLVRAGNGSYNNADRANLATEIEGRLQDMIAIANSTDANGGYLFSGYKTSTVPFARTATGASYVGDQGAQTLQVASSRTLQLSDSGDAVFMNIPNGNGTFRTGAVPGNTGSGTISGGTVVDKTLLTGKDYQIRFNVAGSPLVTTYDIIKDPSSATPVTMSAAVPFVPGQPITVDGMSFTINGAPANNDKFSAAPSQKVSVFETMQSLVTALRTPVTTPASKAALNQALTDAGSGLQNALDNVLTVHASLGARMKELDYLDTAGDNLDTQYASNLKDLVGLDMVKALSLFSEQQLTLEAAQKTFKTTSGLSLFNFI